MGIGVGADANSDLSARRAAPGWAPIEGPTWQGCAPSARWRPGTGNRRTDWPLRQRHARRQHRARTQAARRDQDRDRCGGADARPGSHQRRGSDSRARTLHADLSVLRQQNAHHRDLPTRPDTPPQSLAAPAIDPDRYVMTIVIDARKIGDASSWSGAGSAKPLPVHCSRRHQATLSHPKPHHRDLYRAPRSPNTRPPSAITTSLTAGRVPNYP